MVSNRKPLITCDPNSCFLGIDIGGTKIAIVLLNENLIPIHHFEVLTRVNEGPEAVIEQLFSIIKKTRNKAPGPILSIGVGVAGQVDKQGKRVFFAPNLQWHNVFLAKTLKFLTGLPVLIVNDVRAATFGEWTCGMGKNCNDLVCLFVGTGIGGGIVSQGKLLSGNNNTCGELGHLVVDMNGPPCSCGGYGCMEAFAGGWAIAKGLDRAKGATARAVIEAALKKEPLATQVMDKAIKALIAGCTSLVNALGPKKLVLGGGIMKGFPQAIPLIESGVKAHALKSATKGLEVLPSALGEQAVAIGAALLGAKVYAKKEFVIER